MAIEYNRAWMRDTITSYLKDSSVTQTVLDVWIDIASKRVSTTLECNEMEQTISNKLVLQPFTTVDGGSATMTELVVIDGGNAYNEGNEPLDYIVFPSNWKRLVSVQTLDNGQWRNLRSINKHNAYAYKSDGIPEVYLLEDGKIYPLPLAEGTYRAIFLLEVIIEETGEHPVVAAYPYIFLNAALAEAYDWKQDVEMVARYEGKWQQEADEARRLYRSEHVGETPAMRAI